MNLFLYALSVVNLKEGIQMKHFKNLELTAGAILASLAGSSLASANHLTTAHATTVVSNESSKTDTKQNDGSKTLSITTAKAEAKSQIDNVSNSDKNHEEALKVRNDVIQRNKDAQAKIDKVNQQNNASLINAMNDASKIEGVTVTKDPDQTQKVDAKNIEQGSQKAKQDIQSQIDNANKQIEQMQSENAQIKKENEEAKQQYDKEYKAWQQKNEAYIDKLSQTSGWTKDQISQFLGTDLSKLTYITPSANTTVDHGNLKEATQEELELVKERIPDRYATIANIKSKGGKLFVLQKESSWTYKNAFVDSQTGQEVDAKFVVEDYHSGAGYEDVPVIMTLNGWQGESENQMIVDVLSQANAYNVTINIQYLDHNTGKPVKLMPLFGIGDIDSEQLVQVKNAKKALIGTEIKETSGKDYIGASSGKIGTVPEDKKAQGWFILPLSDQTTFTFGYDPTTTPNWKSYDGYEFGVGGIDTIYDPHKPVLNQKPLKNINLHWHETKLELNKEPIPASITVKYIDQDTGKEISDTQFNQKGNEGDSITYTTADTISKLQSQGYTLVSDDFTGKAGNKLSEDNNGKTYVVTLKKQNQDKPSTPETKNGTQTYHFVDKNTGKVLTTDKVGGKVGEDVSVSLKVPDGYHLVKGQTVPTSANIKDKDNPINILVEKDPIPAKPSTPETKDGTQTIHIIDKKTGNVLTTVVKGGKIGENIPVSLKVPKGYHLVQGQKLPTSVNIKDKDNAINIYVEKDEAKPAVTTPSKNNNSKAIPAPVENAKAPANIANASVKAPSTPVVNDTTDPKQEATLPQTGNSSSTAGVVAGSALLATMATLGIAYRKRKN